MADSSPANPPLDPDLSPDLDPLEIPLDPLFFSGETDPNLSEPFNSDDLDLGFCFEDNGAFDLTFGDLDDLYLPSENETFLIPNSNETPVPIYSESESSAVSADHAQDVAAYLNCVPSESGTDRSSVNQKLDVDRALNIQSPDNSGDQEFSGGPVSSQGSGNCGGELGGSADTNIPSPGCDNSADRDVSSKLVVSQRVKSEETGNVTISKRKKEQEDPITKSESRSKYRRSSICTDKASSQCTVDAGSEEDEKKKARLMRNRESAQLSRQRKKHYVEELEEKVRNMHSTIAELNSKISFIMAENLTLRQQLGGGGMCPPPPGMYPPPPMPHMAYPWVPCAPYVMKPHGSQVPLVPIPRLRPQQAVSASKPKKAEGKKNEGKTKKVASVSFLGLLFFVLLFGGLVPMVNVRFGGIGDGTPGGMGYFSDGNYDNHRGRVLAVTGHRNGSYHATERGKISQRMDGERGRGQHGANGESVHSGNGSEPLVASLYVPRNDKLVKIDGNLIIHSVLASEKAMASRAVPESKNDRGTELAMLKNLASALAIPDAQTRRGQHPYTYPTDRQRALASGSGDPLKDHIKKSISANGRLQEWFREGLAGPILSSGMCTEVFQFDVSPSPGAIIPAASVGNITSEQGQNVTQVGKGRNRRVLRGLPFPVPESNLSQTAGNSGKNPKGGNFPGNKSLSSMVVSVLVDPREAGESEVDGVIRPKSLSRIFVVVLLDSIKYVTYSCVLPRAGPHLVTT